MKKRDILIIILILLFTLTPIVLITQRNNEVDNKDNQKTQYNIIDEEGNVIDTASKEELIELVEPYKEGYTFIDWYTDPEFKKTFNGYINKETKVYPRFEKNKYQVTFNLEGGTMESYDEVIVSYKESIIKPSNPEREGYNFIGWFLNDTDEEPFEFNSLITGNVSLIAKYEKIHNAVLVNKEPINLNREPVKGNVIVEKYFTVTFDNGIISKVKGNTKVPVPSEPEKFGHIFKGWYSDEALTKEFDFNTLVNSDTKLYAKFVQDGPIKLNFKTKDNSLNEIIELEEGTLPSPLVNTTSLDKESKSIVGWYSDEEMTTDFDFNNEVTNSSTIYVETKEWTDPDYFITNENTITGYKEEGPKDVVIPKYINGVLMDTIGSKAFASKSLISTSIPSSIKTIGDKGFSSNNIKEIVLPDSVEFIDMYGFAYNDIENIVFSKSLKEVGIFTFSNNKIKNLSIPGTVETIQPGGFGGNDIEKLTISDDVKNILGGAFNDNKLPDSEAFIYKRENGIVYKNVVTSYAGLKRENIVVPDSFTEIGDYSFSMCIIKSIKLSDNIKVIGMQSFVFNPLTEITLPKNLETIKDGAFEVNDIKKVVIPVSLVNFGKNVFDKYDLEEIYMPGRTVNEFGKDWYDSEEVEIKFEEPSN